MEKGNKKQKQDKKKVVTFEPGQEQEDQKQEKPADGGGKPTMTQEEKRAQREAVNKKKAEMKAAAKLKKEQKAQQEAEGGKESAKQPANNENQKTQLKEKEEDTKTQPTQTADNANRPVMTPEEKKAQREAANKKKAEMKAAAKLKKEQQNQQEDKQTKEEKSGGILKKKVTEPQTKVQQKAPQPEPQQIVRKTSNRSDSVSNFAPNIELKEHIDFSSDKNLDVNPAILQLAVQLQNNTLQTANQITIGTLLAIKEFFRDFQPPGDRTLFHEMNDEWTKVVNFIKETKQLHAGVDNALEDTKRVMQQTCEEFFVSLDEFRNKISDWIDSYIEDKIIYAQEEMVRQGLKLLSRSKKQKKDHIMIIGLNIVFEKLFVKAKEEGIDFTVIVVDTSPRYMGRDVVKRLSVQGIDCKYTLIQGVSALIQQTSKLFVGASYILGNGGVVSQMGTSMVSYLASQHKVPVIAFCETYKFTQRVNVDQIKGNELGDPKDITHNYLLPQSWPKEDRDLLLNQKSLTVLNLKYDFTSINNINMILCEIGRVSPVSVSVVVDEFNAEKNQDA